MGRGARNPRADGSGTAPTPNGSDRRFALSGVDSDANLITGAVFPHAEGPAPGAGGVDDELSARSGV
jgi:hypothetical protein